MNDMQDGARHRDIEAAYSSYADDVYRLAYAILHDRDDAADATQETFVRAFHRWDRYDPDRPLRPWLHTIVSRVAFDQLRRRRVRWLAMPVLAERSAMSSEDAYAGRDPGSSVPRRQAIEEALEGLAPVARAAVLLRHRYGYEYTEIAGFLGISVSNVGAVLTRARARLRAQLDDAPVMQEERA